MRRQFHTSKHLEAIRTGEAAVADYLHVLSNAIPDSLRDHVSKLQANWGQMHSRVDREILQHWMACLDAIADLRRADELQLNHSRTYDMILRDLAPFIEKLDVLGIRVSPFVQDDVAAANAA